MSGCEELRHELGGYVVGGLAEDEVARVEAHLAECGACRAELEELSGLPALLELASDESPPVPPDLRDRVVATATAGGRRGRRRPALLAAAAAALAGLVLGAGAVLALTGEPPADARLTLDEPALAAAEAFAGRAELRDTPAGVRVDLEASGLPAGHDVGYYHVWLEWPSGNRISAGTFVPDADGETAATLTCGGELADYAALAITAHARDAEPQTLVRAELE